MYIVVNISIYSDFNMTNVDITRWTKTTSKPMMWNGLCYSVQCSWVEL